MQTSCPPLTMPKPMMGRYFFWFKKGLAIASALRRLAIWRKLVSKPHLSLIDRPWRSEGRIQKVYYFQCVVVFEGAPFSKSQAVLKYDANRGTGLRAVVLGGQLTFAAVCITVCSTDFLCLRCECANGDFSTGIRKVDSIHIVTLNSDQTGCHSGISKLESRGVCFATCLAFWRIQNSIYSEFRITTLFPNLGFSPL